MKLSLSHVSILLLNLDSGALALSSSSSKPHEKVLSRRESLKAVPASFLSAATALQVVSLPNVVNAGESAQNYAYESRNRNKNKDALVRNDIW